MAPGNPELTPEVQGHLQSALELAENVNAIREENNGISGEFLRALATSKDPDHQDLLREFSALSSDESIQNIEDISGLEPLLRDIDGLLASFPSDKDLNGVPDSIQASKAPEWDRNSDGIPDSIQSGTNNATMFGDSDGDGIPDYMDGSNDQPVADIDPLDWDGDGIPNHIDTHNPTILDQNGDGIYDVLQGPGTYPSTATDLDGDGIPDVIQAAPDESADEDTDTEVKSVREGRATFETRKDSLISGENGSFTISGLNANDVKWSKFADWNENFLGETDPNTVNVKVGEDAYTWNDESHTWQNEAGNDYLKVYGKGLRFTVEAKPAEPEAAPADVEPAAEVVVPDVEVSLDGPPAPPKPLTPEQVADKEDKLAQSREFTESLLSVEKDMDKLVRQYEKMQRMDKKDLENKDRYNREGLELIALTNEMHEKLATLRGNFTALQTNGVYPADAPTAQLREEKIAGFESKQEEVIGWLHNELEQDNDAPESVESGSGIELRGRKRQAIFDDILNLPSSQTVNGRTLPLSEGWGEVIHVDKSGNNYTQFVENGYVTRRLVQLDADGDGALDNEWHEIPYVNYIEEAKASAYQAIENDDPNDQDRSRYQPDKQSPAWQNRYKAGALKLRKFDR